MPKKKWIVYQHVHIDKDIEVEVEADDSEDEGLGLGYQKFARMSDAFFNHHAVEGCDLGIVLIRLKEEQDNGGTVSGNR